LAKQIENAEVGDDPAAKNVVLQTVATPRNPDGPLGDGKYWVVNGRQLTATSSPQPRLSGYWEAVVSKDTPPP
jgi:hypothetical protein